jgi:hypothetical protein
MSIATFEGAEEGMSVAAVPSSEGIVGTEISLIPATVTTSRTIIIAFNRREVRSVAGIAAHARATINLGLHRSGVTSKAERGK